MGSVSVIESCTSLSDGNGSWSGSGGSSFTGGAVRCRSSILSDIGPIGSVGTGSGGSEITSAGGGGSFGGANEIGIEESPLVNPNPDPNPFNFSPSTTGANGCPLTSLLVGTYP